MDSGVRAEEPPGYLLVPCTEASGASCHLSKHLNECNKLLLQIGLDLRRDERLNNGADLRVGIVPGIPSGFPWSISCQEGLETVALNLLAGLLENHRCIKALEFNGNSRNSTRVLAAVRRNRAIKSITVCGMDHQNYQEERRLFRTIATLDHLEELLFKDTCPDAYSKMSLSGFPLLDRGKRHLAVLDVGCPDMSPKEAKRFIRALTRNKSIVDLTVGRCVFTSGSGHDHSGARFARYLRHPATTLLKLTLKAKSSPNEQVLQRLLSAVSQVATLQDFSADFVIFGEGLYVHSAFMPSYEPQARN